MIDTYSLSQKDEVRLGIGHGAWGIGHRVPWAYLTFLRTAINIKETGFFTSINGSDPVFS